MGAPVESGLALGKVAATLARQSLSALSKYSTNSLSLPSMNTSVLNVSLPDGEWRYSIPTSVRYLVTLLVRVLCLSLFIACMD